MIVQLPFHIMNKFENLFADIKRWVVSSMWDVGYVLSSELYIAWFYVESVLSQGKWVLVQEEAPVGTMSDERVWVEIEAEVICDYRC
jgi:hypothetical protein